MKESQMDAYAERAHEQHDEHWKFARDTSVRVGLAAINSTFYLNGGAAIAVMALIGNLVEQDKSIEVYNTVLGWLAAGVLSSALAMCLGYIASHIATRSIAEQDKIFYHPFIRDNPKSKLLSSWSDWALYGAICAAFGSVITFLIATICFVANSS